MTNRSAAAFGQADWKLFEQWQATLGLRYTKDEKYGTEFDRLIEFDPTLGGSLTPALDITQAVVGGPAQLASGARVLPNGNWTRYLESDSHAFPSGMTAWLPPRNFGIEVQYRFGSAAR